MMNASAKLPDHPTTIEASQTVGVRQAVAQVVRNKDLFTKVLVTPRSPRRDFMEANAVAPSPDFVDLYANFLLRNYLSLAQKLKTPTDPTILATLKHLATRAGQFNRNEAEMIDQLKPKLQNWIAQNTPTSVRNDGMILLLVDSLLQLASDLEWGVLLGSDRTSKDERISQVLSIPPSLPLSPQDRYKQMIRRILDTYVALCDEFDIEVAPIILVQIDTLASLNDSDDIDNGAALVTTLQQNILAQIPRESNVEIPPAQKASIDSLHESLERYLTVVSSFFA